MGNDLISRKALKEAIAEYHAGLFPRYISKLVDAEIADIQDIIDKQAAVEAEPVRHGVWVAIGAYDEDGYYDIDYKCSECGRFEPCKQPYCHCGAKMDGGADCG